MEQYEPVIGLEIHAELLTDSKMFCGCRVVDSVESPPNRAVCPVCLGMPGMLPVINRRAVDFALRVALALNCEIQTYNIFARKNYFYPDLPKAYQISQYELPLARNGYLDIALESGESRRIRIRRVHMEEDTGKLTHLDQGGSLVDYNRSGVPLLEIVSEPDIRSGEEARVYAAKIRQILRYLEVNTGDMEKGVFRVEPNISIRPIGSSQFGTRTELKNLNSFRSLADGVDFELQRQAAVLQAGKEVVQETRGWHDTKRVTFSQRVKEEADDYRYFAEPDLPALQISEDWIQRIRLSLPELPDEKMARYQETLALSDYEAQVLSEDRQVAAYYDAAVDAGGDPRWLANWVINELFRLMNEHDQTVDEIKVTAKNLVALNNLVAKGTINNNTAKDVLAEMFASGQDAKEIVQARGLAQISDEAALREIVLQVMEENADEVAAYRSGEKQQKLHGWFVGQVMRATRGKANPALVNQMLGELLAGPN